MFVKQLGVTVIFNGEPQPISTQYTIDDLIAVLYAKA